MSKKFIREYFNFTTREKNGLLVLFIILFGIIITNFIANNQKDLTRVDFTKFEEEIDNFLYSGTTETSEIVLSPFDPNTASREQLILLGLPGNVVNNIIRYRESGGVFYNAESLERIYGLKEDEFNRIKDYIVIESANHRIRYKGSQYQTTAKVELFYFDPNTATESDFIKLGLSEPIAQRVINYRNSGGSFQKPDDFARIYGLREKKFNELKPYIQIENKEEIIDSTLKEKEEFEFIPLEINSANRDELQNLRGIGPTFANSIVAYRFDLGGFYDKKQLKEIYEINEENFEIIAPQITVNQDKIKKININSADFKALESHPYISRQTANLILEFKEFRGEITDTYDLVKQRVINNNQYEKLQWYITVE